MSSEALAVRRTVGLLRFERRAQSASAGARYEGSGEGTPRSRVSKSVPVLTGGERLRARRYPFGRD